MNNKKYLFLFLAVLTLSLTALFLTQEKTVSAVTVDIEHSYEVIAYLPDNAVWQNTDTVEAVRYGWFDPVAKVFYGYRDQHNDAMDTDKFYISPVAGYRFVEYSLVQYHGNDLSMSYHGSSLINDDWINQLSGDYNDQIIIDYLVDSNYISLSFVYRTSVITDNQGNITGFNTVTNSYNVLRDKTLSENNITPPSPITLGGEVFVNWTYEFGLINPTIITITDLSNFKFLYSGTLTANYSATVFNVTFYNGLNVLATEVYASGQGTISPPNFNFGVGNRLQGWSTSIAGDIINLSTFVLDRDLVLYANLVFDGSFENTFGFEYQDCGIWDISCHLGNAAIYFITEMPVISDIFALFLPIGSLFQTFADYLVVFDSLGWIFSIGLGVLFISFILKFLK